MSRLAVAGLLTGALALAAFPIEAASPNAAYALHATPLFAGASSSQIAGSVTPGTPLDVTGPAANGRTPVSIAAWSQQGDATTLVVAQGQRIVLATLTAAARPTVVSTSKDSYGNTWSKVQFSGFVATNALTADQATVWAAASTLYAARCSVCHALHKPGEFTANQWPSIIKTMSKNAALQPAQTALITQYLQSHAK